MMLVGPHIEFNDDSRADDRHLGICVGNLVFDVTAFMLVHPGGASIIEAFAGKQCDWQVGYTIFLESTFALWTC